MKIYSRFPSFYTFLVVVLVLYFHHAALAQEKPAANLPFFGLQPKEIPQILLPGVVSSVLSEYNGTFSPDGTEFFYTSEFNGKGTLVHMKLDPKKGWSEPTIASFSGIYSEYDPLFSPDGTALYFSSERPIDDHSEAGTTHIWRCERMGEDWSAPKHVVLTGTGDYYSSLTNLGSIYFNTWNDGKMLRAIPTDVGYDIEQLPDAIFSGSYTGDPFISPAGDYLIFRAYYDEGFGRGDLYISFKINDEWTKPENLGPTVNSSAHEICPYVTSDGKMFIFSSDKLTQSEDGASLQDQQKRINTYDNGNSNVYYMSASFIEHMRQAHSTK